MHNEALDFFFSGFVTGIILAAFLVTYARYRNLDE